MNDVSPIAAAKVALLPACPLPDAASAIFAAAEQLLPQLERGQRVNATILRAAMEAAFGASDASGAWDWKMAYDACEVATILFLRKYGRALFRKAASPASRLSVLAKIVGLLPTHTRRSAESETFQQFSTPIPLGLAALTAVAVTPADRVLEPSVGRASSPSSPRSPAARSSSTSWPKRAPVCSPSSFRPSPSLVSTLRRSTIIFILPASRVLC